MYFSILRNEFNPNILIDSEINVPFDSFRDFFYNTLLKDINNQKLYDSIINIRNNRTSLSNLSHTVYLLPWSQQNPFTSTVANQNLSSKNKKANKNLKQNLSNYIKNVKRLSVVSSYLLKLRLTGYTNRTNLIYTKLRDLHKQRKTITTICKINNQIVKYTGKLLLFDINLNILLFNKFVIYINNKTIVSIIY